MSTFGSLQAQLERLKQEGKGGKSEKRTGLRTFVPVYAPAKPQGKEEDETTDSDTEDNLEGFTMGDDGSDYDDDGNVIESEEESEDSDSQQY
ncbi:hypothetical protein ACKC9G_04480 [Pokkaliibacter sp. CJK22405]|uniref:hypothetical protein n=1 Tax=Pokkaliibacter sp. CJK22405 TaxID=3384615 RepID=UPI0039846A2D